MNMEKIIYLKLRFIMAFIFLWAFFDKTFGLGFATPTERAWIHGGSPTFGFLTNAVKGPFVDLFHSLARIGAVDWLFMLGLLFADSCIEWTSAPTNLRNGAAEVPRAPWASSPPAPS